jgi:cell wall-associated NlpC family hydrolase
MTIAAIPVLPALPGLAPFIAANGDKVAPGCYGVSHGGGITGELIRHAPESRAGHAFLYIGNGRIIEAVPPAVRVARAVSHPDAVWNVSYPLTDAQRARICARARALVGSSYDYPAYTGFALKVLKLDDGAELDPVFKADHWRVSSELIADCYAHAGIRLPRPALARPA